MIPSRAPLACSASDVGEKLLEAIGDQAAIDLLARLFDGHTDVVRVEFIREKAGAGSVVRETHVHPPARRIPRRRPAVARNHPEPIPCAPEMEKLLTPMVRRA